MPFLMLSALPYWNFPTQSRRHAPVGDIHTFSEPDVTTIFTEEELVLLAFEYAGNVTVAGLGTVEGAT